MRAVAVVQCKTGQQRGDSPAETEVLNGLYKIGDYYYYYEMA